MVFDKFNNEYNLSRFCNLLNVNVIDSESKLLSFFIENYNPEEITSIMQKEFDYSNLLYNLGFKLTSTTEPNFKYLIDRMRMDKKKYLELNLLYDSTNENILLENLNTFSKIYDCGQMKFEMTIKQKN